MITTFKKLYNKFVTFIQEELPERRLQNDAQGRRWFAKSVGYSDKFTLEDLNNFVDRDELNSRYMDRVAEKNPKQRLGISALKMEISLLHSFNKCFVERYKGRLHIYRDDLSQKGGRVMQTVARSAARFNKFKTNLDSSPKS